MVLRPSFRPTTYQAQHHHWPLPRGMGTKRRTPDEPLRLLDLPPEVMSYIVRLIYLESIPRSTHRNLDLHGLPSTYSDGRRISTPHSDVQSTLWALCLTCKGFFHHARPLLYRRIHVTLPYSFVLLIRTLGAAALATAYEQFQQTGMLNQDPRDPYSFPSLVAAAGFARVLGTKLIITHHCSEGELSLIRRSSSSDGTGRTTLEDTDDEHLDLVWQPGEYEGWPALIIAPRSSHIDLTTAQTPQRLKTPVLPATPFPYARSTRRSLFRAASV